MPTIPQEIAKAIIDPHAYADGHSADEAYTWLRHNAPLDVAQLDGYDPFWVVTRHADILEIERQANLFCNASRPGRIMSQITVEQMAKAQAGLGGLGMLLNMDAPEHMKYRRLTQKSMMPGPLRPREDRIRQIARGFVDRLIEKGDQCDFVADIALLYPLHVVMEIMGVPESDEPRMLMLTQQLASNTDPELNRTGEATSGDIDVQAAMAALSEFMGYFHSIIQDRQSNPRDDLASIIANGRVDERPLTPVEIISYYIILATAGHDTTSSTVGGGMWALAERPDQFAKLKADPALISSFVDEALRWTTPVKHFTRAATQDVEYAGRRISKGDWLMMAYPSGNRDETVFDKPFEFRVDRSPNPQVSFGYGPHVCLGQHLAKMEMQILWEELLPRLKSVELNGTPKLTTSAHLVGPKTLPLRLEFA